jgi:hypothetical protein
VRFGVAADDFVGLPLARARELAAQHGVLLRVLEPGRRTDDLVNRRVNVEVEAGRIVRIDGVY